ncbi:MAG: hypothetical protein ABSG72_01580 [Candidatus Sulfotelmatobacter sp.]|jgi:hypothetical protein
MLTYKLVQLIQYHSDTLAASLLHQVQMSERAESYRNVSPAELKETVHEIYRHLGEWLLHKSENDIAQRYRAIGARRVEQNVPLNELVWVIVLTKRNLWTYIDDVSLPGRAVETAEKQEMLRHLELFFDEATHAAVAGYESAAQNLTRTPQAAAKPREKARKAS